MSGRGEKGRSPQEKREIGHARDVKDKQRVLLAREEVSRVKETARRERKGQTPSSSGKGAI